MVQGMMRGCSDGSLSLFETSETRFLVCVVAVVMLWGYPKMGRSEECQKSAHLFFEYKTFKLLVPSTGIV